MKKELKNRLTQYFQRTKQGEEVIVTERGNPIALFQSIKSAERVVSREARLAKLAAQGVITLPTEKPGEESPPGQSHWRPDFKNHPRRSSVNYQDTSAFFFYP